MAHTIDHKVVEEVSRRSGLKASSVHDLLEAGYCYVEDIRQPVKWIREAQFHVTDIGKGHSSG